MVPQELKWFLAVPAVVLPGLWPEQLGKGKEYREGANIGKTISCLPRLIKSNK